jgi:hypothetical protein
VTLPLLPDGWLDLPPEQRRQWDQLQLQHAHYEWRRSVMLQHRAVASSVRLARLVRFAVTPTLLVLVVAALTIIAR